MSWKSHRVGLIAVPIVLLVAGSVWGIYHWSSAPDEPALPEELTVAKLREQMSDPRTSFRGMRETMERKDLTDEQRQQARRNMGQVFRTMMGERVDEFFAASEEEKTAVLDRHIDEMQEFMQRMREEREEREREKSDEEREKEREEWRERMREQRGNATTQQRKARSESRSPDERARQMSYWMAMSKRMGERGIEMPWGRGGRGGGGGGGRGGHGGGGRGG